MSDMSNLDQYSKKASTNISIRRS